MSRLVEHLAVYVGFMAAQGTLLCIHREPGQLSLLKEHGYELVTAANGHDGLRLFMSRPVDAIVLQYHLGLLDGATIAAEIKQVRPKVPIVMLIDHMELPDGALNSVDALVATSDGPHFLLATVHFVLNVKPAQSAAAKLTARTPFNRLRGGSGIAGQTMGLSERLIPEGCLFRRAFGRAFETERSNSDPSAVFTPRFGARSGG